jgi:hypothetical protein
MATTKREIDEIVTDIVKDWLEERTNQMKAILESKGISPKSGALLPQDIKVPPINITATNYQAQLELEDYYEFVDEGVKGIQNQRPNTGRFSFKNDKPNRKMVESIQDWGARKGRQGVTKVNARSVAYATAISVKRKGIRETRFFRDSTEDRYTEQLITALQEALGKSFEVSIINA